MRSNLILLAAVQKRRKIDLQKLDHRMSNFESEFGNAYFNARMQEANRTFNIEKLRAVQAEVKEICRGLRLRRKLLKSEADLHRDTANLRYYRELNSSLNNSARVFRERSKLKAKK